MPLNKKNGITLRARLFALFALTWTFCQFGAAKVQASTLIPFQASYDLALELEISNPPFGTITSAGSMLATHL